MFSLSSALCGNTGFFPGESLRNSRRRSRNLWNSFQDVHAQLKQQTVAAIPASLASDDSHRMLQDGTKIIIIPCLPTWAGSSFPDSKNSLRNSRTLAIKSRVFHRFSTFAASVHLLQYCYWPGLRHHRSQHNSEFLPPLNSPRRLRVAFSVCCRLLLITQRPTAVLFFSFFGHFYEIFSSRARPVPCRIVQCLVTCVLVFMYLRTLVSCGFCCLIWDQIKSDWCWGNKWTGVFNNLWYAVTLNKNMETRCEYCFIISVLMSFDNEDCW